MMKVAVTVTPLQGKPKKEKIEVEMTVTGTTVGEILTKMGVDPKGKNFMVSGKPAKLDSVVAKGKNLKVTEVEVAVTERPRGS